VRREGLAWLVPSRTLLEPFLPSNFHSSLSAWNLSQAFLTLLWFTIYIYTYLLSPPPAQHQPAFPSFLLYLSPYYLLSTSY
jgi:hypothetical protein